MGYLMGFFMSSKQINSSTNLVVSIKKLLHNYYMELVQH